MIKIVHEDQRAMAIQVNELHEEVLGSRNSMERIEDLTFETLIKRAFSTGNVGALELQCLAYGHVLEQREASR